MRKAKVIYGPTALICFIERRIFHKNTNSVTKMTSSAHGGISKKIFVGNIWMYDDTWNFKPISFIFHFDWERKGWFFHLFCVKPSFNSVASVVEFFFLYKTIMHVHTTYMNIQVKYVPHKEIRSIFFPLPYEDGSRAVIGGIL